ncbi:Putative small multi-drug export protein [Tenuibacillus multivorans]|uniref:Putative small multi-drug export protein n=2 Tax=Tenuibacillus multivorans TaxID=237069 RepID=A0A1H0DZR1_9BACI|nr:Putative small multi-drug export protein [Tenuibacillus multivorans]
MMEYIWLCFMAWFIGFFPMFEIYIAIPATMAVGLDGFSSVLWSCVGNFMAIPLIVFFYDKLSRFERINKFLLKTSVSRFSHKIRKGSFGFILLTTPIVGSWTIGVLCKLIGLSKKKIFTSSAISIALYGLIIGILTKLGIDSFY